MNTTEQTIKPYVIPEKLSSGSILDRRRYENLLHNLDVLVNFLNEPNITDIKVLDTGRIILKYFKEGKVFTDIYLDEDRRRRILNDISTITGHIVDMRKNPVLESTIPGYGCRIQGMYPPRVKSPTFAIRKPLGFVIPLEQYVSEGRLSQEHLDCLIELVIERKNILIGGSTGSGKTTFANSIIQKMADYTPEDSFYIVEDNPELTCNAIDNTMVITSPHESHLAVESALRWNPDRIIFGELRHGPTTDELMTAWNTGHTGNIATIHANSAKDMLLRVEGLLRKNSKSGVIPDITRIINACVFISTKKDFGPFIKQILILSDERAWEVSNGEKEHN